MPSWAIDNVYVGMQCQDHCLGHGACFNGVICDCDDGFSLASCVPIRRRPAHLLEDFDGLLIYNSFEKGSLIYPQLNHLKYAYFRVVYF